ncbi:MAG: Flp pilus assembly complex ATPase component TadA [Candidatus Zixiibacteriota bacterium]|nr:MAG: Flp pilus assembly complex ATPase component TadA [candidate division Zixibacteria bacterium]
MASKVFKKRIGELLVESGAISPEQLKIALDKQKTTGQRIGQVLISLGMISEEKLMQTTAQKLDIPQINLEDMVIDRDVVSIISAGMAKKHLLIPLFRIGNVLTIAMYDPLDFIALDEISYYTKMVIKRVVASKSDIEMAIERHYSIGEAVSKVVEGMKAEELAVDVDEIDVDIEKDITDDMPVVKLINLIIYRGIKSKASDLHLDPDEGGLRIRFRIDGIMHDVARLPKTLIMGAISRVKVMANMDVSEKRLPQDGRFQVKFKETLVDFRVSSIPTPFGEKMAIRILDKSGLILEINKMGFSQTNLKQWLDLIGRPEGLILITGPTGSGKTSTLYATLSRISTPEKSVVTVEDPIEYNLPLVTQVQINEKAGLTFAVALRSIVRQNPDIIMVGEIRDIATAEISIRASMTGHLVFSTLHTSDAPVAINRLMDMGIEPYLVSTSVSAVLAQRLVRVLCDNCKAEQKKIDAPTQELVERYNLNGPIVKPVGCTKCSMTGYSGRTAINELLLMSPQLQELSNRKAPHVELRRQALKEGLISIRADGLSKVAAGITTIEEVVRVSHDDDFSLDNPNLSEKTILEQIGG